MNNLLWLTQVIIITLAKNDNLKAAELAVLGSSVSLKSCVLYVQ